MSSADQDRGEIDGGVGKELTEDQGVYRSLPDVGSLNLQQRKKATALLKELENIQRIKERETAIKAELEVIQLAAKQPGLRYGNLCFISKTMEGKRTLDRMLLIENGVTAEIIKNSMKLGKGFQQRTFKKIEAD